MTPLDRSARLQWTAPASTGGAPIIGYSVERRRIGGTWTAAGTTTAAGSLVVTGLANGDTFEFRVAARNRGGTGPFITRAMWLPLPPFPEYRGISPGPNRLTIAWQGDAPADPVFGSPVLVRIDRTTPGRTGWTTAGTTTMAAGRFVVTGLINGQRYSLRIGFLYANGEWSWTPGFDPRIPVSVPTAPAIRS